MKCLGGGGGFGGGSSGGGFGGGLEDLEVWDLVEAGKIFK
jgi:hypothetical protein